ncbi:hypothetical protein ACFT5B_15085 [Luteimicrobium sp. NPDC057192]|uniref:hypothetical protein n=1 Tax=Luteimicrobium sp. NPDC057192 TaxID=3346042 RepID=UPI0036266587
MSTQQPGTGPVPEGTDGSQDATQRLDPVEGSGAPTERLAATAPLDSTPQPDPTQRLDLPEADARDGGTRVLPAEEPGVDALWTLDAPDDDTPGTPAASPAAAPVAPEPPRAQAYPAAPEPAAGPARSGRRAIRVGAVVWGLVVVVCGVLALAVAGGATVDGGTVAIGVLAGAGVALVLGSIVTGVRRRDRS